jgi:hypothetical protein
MPKAKSKKPVAELPSPAESREGTPSEIQISDAEPPKQQQDEEPTGRKSLKRKATAVQPKASKKTKGRSSGPTLHGSRKMKKSDNAVEVSVLSLVAHFSTYSVFGR